jgi:hypothetical protein
MLTAIERRGELSYLVLESGVAWASPIHSTKRLGRQCTLITRGDCFISLWKVLADPSRSV